MTSTTMSDEPRSVPMKLGCDVADYVSAIRRVGSALRQYDDRESPDV